MPQPRGQVGEEANLYLKWWGGCQERCLGHVSGCPVLSARLSFELGDRMPVFTC